MQHDSPQNESETVIKPQFDVVFFSIIELYLRVDLWTSP